MNKILVEIYLPATNSSYDVYIPLKIKLFEVLTLVSSSLTELSKGYFIASDDVVICDKEKGTILDINLSAEELGLQNGSKLMLI